MKHKNCIFGNRKKESKNYKDFTMRENIQEKHVKIYICDNKSEQTFISQKLISTEMNLLNVQS